MGRPRTRSLSSCLRPQGPRDIHQQGQARWAPTEWSREEKSSSVDKPRASVRQSMKRDKAGTSLHVSTLERALGAGLPSPSFIKEPLCAKHYAEYCTGQSHSFCTATLGAENGHFHCTDKETEAQRCSITSLCKMPQSPDLNLFVHATNIY